MDKVKKRTFSLTVQQSDFIDRKVASGAYASGSEVMREGLRALQERDAAIERWLVEQVVPTLQAYEREPSRGMTPAQLRENIHAWYEEMTKSAAE